MADDSAIANYARAVSTQQKFEFYALGLTFTILGLSVQTSKFGVSLVPDGLEVASWLALLVSGLFGLRRLERMPQFYELAGHLQSRQARLRMLMEAKFVKHVGNVQVADEGLRPIDAEIGATKDAVQQIEEASKPKEDELVTLYHRQRAFFVAGFALLIAARAYGPAVQIGLAIARIDWRAAWHAWWGKLGIAIAVVGAVVWFGLERANAERADARVARG